VLTSADLKRVKLFEGLPEKELTAIARELKEVEQPPGKRVTTVGTGVVGFSVILDGEAEVSTVDGRKRVLKAGDHFGEMALLDQGDRSAEIVARTALRLGVLPEWGFKPFLADQPEVACRLLQTRSRRLREAEAAAER